MKLIGPVAPPGVRHKVKLKDGSICVAYMAFGHNNIPDGTWLSDGQSVEVDEIIERHLPINVALNKLLNNTPPNSQG